MNFFQRIISCCQFKKQAPIPYIQPQHIIKKKDEYEILQNIQYKDTTKFIPTITFGKVVKVYDGDTITLASKLHENSPIYRFSVRIRDIDSPEIKGQTSNEKKLAIQSRDALHSLIFGKIVYLRNVDIEKYGRILAHVIYCEDDIEINIGQWMLENEFAVKYDGGTKIRPNQWNEV
jgi:endonuclease YncB( thermonuclease family)